MASTVQPTVLYHLASRGIEYDLLPRCQQHSLPVMAYCPLAQAGRLRDGLFSIAISLIWLTRGDYGSATAARRVIRHPGVLAIPKAASIEHVVQNAAALDIALSGEELAQLDRLYPPPQRKPGWIWFNPSFTAKKTKARYQRGFCY